MSEVPWDQGLDRGLELYVRIRDARAESLRAEAAFVRAEAAHDALAGQPGEDEAFRAVFMCELDEARALEAWTAAWEDFEAWREEYQGVES